jgi:hypothetical protein
MVQKLEEEPEPETEQETEPETETELETEPETESVERFPLYQALLYTILSWYIREN